MKRHEATLARRCPTCCAPKAVVCVWPGRKTTHDVPHPARLLVVVETEAAGTRAPARGAVLGVTCRQCRAPAGIPCYRRDETDDRLAAKPHEVRALDARAGKRTA